MIFIESLKWTSVYLPSYCEWNPEQVKRVILCKGSVLLIMSIIWIEFLIIHPGAHRWSASQNKVYSSKNFFCFFFVRQFVMFCRQKDLKVVPIYSLCRVLGNSVPRSVVTAVFNHSDNPPKHVSNVQCLHWRRIPQKTPKGFADISRWESPGAVNKCGASGWP